MGGLPDYYLCVLPAALLENETPAICVPGNERSMVAMQWQDMRNFILAAALVVLSACFDQPGGSPNQDETAVLVPVELQGQYTLTYNGAAKDGLVDGNDYSIIIASDNSLTVGQAVMRNPKREDLFGTGSAPIVWRNGDFAYVLSTLSDGSLKEINVYDTRLALPSAFVGQLAREFSQNDDQSSPPEDNQVAGGPVDNKITGLLNDTGVLFSGNYPQGNNEDCIVVPQNEQDCSFGRDQRYLSGGLGKTGKGYGGFDFIKLDAAGQKLADQSQAYQDQPWRCVKDMVTGLVWEVKYTGMVEGSDGQSTDIYSPDKKFKWGGKTANLKQDAAFGDRYNDWDELIDQANSDKLCGFDNWRVPTLSELRSLVIYGKYTTTIDTDYFPNAHNSWYWSANAFANSPDEAIRQYFDATAASRTASRYIPGYVRLVSGQP